MFFPGSVQGRNIAIISKGAERTSSDGKDGGVASMDIGRESHDEGVVARLPEAALPALRPGDRRREVRGPLEDAPEAAGRGRRREGGYGTVKRIVVVETDIQYPELAGGWIPPTEREPGVWILWVPKGTVVGP